LGNVYSFVSKTINFKNYGANSSRQRTLVIGVRKDFLERVTPFEIFPDFVKEKNLKEVIGNFKSLKSMCEYDALNPFHNFKKYDPKIRDWIKNLKQGQTAFENEDLKLRPHKIVNGVRKNYYSGFGDKYKRQC
jgi:DNA (cytosine-5)-methyltransferase 1